MWFIRGKEGASIRRVTRSYGKGINLYKGILRPPILIHPQEAGTLYRVKLN
jgi:hypothetical protein